MGEGKYRVARREEIEIGSPIPGFTTAGAGSARAGAEDDPLRGIVEGVEFRGSVTGYRVRTDFGIVHVDVWSVQHGRTYQRGEEVALHIRDDARVVEKS